jgi:hypothetical protein
MSVRYSFKEKHSWKFHVLLTAHRQYYRKWYIHGCEFYLFRRLVKLCHHLYGWSSNSDMT